MSGRNEAAGIPGNEDDRNGFVVEQDWEVGIGERIEADFDHIGALNLSPMHVVQHLVERLSK